MYYIFSIYRLVVPSIYDNFLFLCGRFSMFGVSESMIGKGVEEKVTF